MNSKRVSIAVAVTALGLAVAPGAAFADGQQPCGTPAMPAVYSTVVVPGTPAVTHEESEWSLVTQVVERLWHRWVVDSPATPDVYTTIHHDAVYWTFTIPGLPAWDQQVLVTPAYDEKVVTDAYDEKVVDVPEHDVQELVTAAYDEKVVTPAVYVTEYEFVSKHGKVRWETDPNWNANGNSNSVGWVGTGQTRQTLVSSEVTTIVHHDDVYKTVTVPATYKTVTVPDTYKTVHHDAVYQTVTVPATYRTVHHDAVTTTVHHDAVWTTVHHPATPSQTIQWLIVPAWDQQVLVTPATPEVGHWEEQWAVDSPGSDWSDTGETRTVAGETQTVWAAESPGQYWTPTGQTRTVEDAPAVPESTTEVLVSGAIPAGPACPDEPTTGGGEEVVPVPANPASAVPGAAGLGKPAAAANPTSELAFTGSDPRLTLLGLGFVLTGIGVSAGYRKVARQGR